MLSPCPFATAWIFGAFVLVAGCTASGENQLRRARLDVAERGAAGVADRAIREAQATEFELTDRQVRLEGLRLALDRVRASERARSAELRAVLDSLSALEEDLQAANSRRSKIEASLAQHRESLAKHRELEAAVAENAKRLAGLRARGSGAADELAALEAAEAEARAELAGRRAMLARRVERLFSIIQALDAFESDPGPGVGSAESEAAGSEVGTSRPASGSPGSEKPGAEKPVPARPGGVESKPGGDGS